MVNGENQYISPRQIREKMDVSAGTVRRWARLYGWERKVINARVIRYDITEVEKSLGVKFV